MISKETLNFLKNLDKNNNRDWFQTNKKEFEKAKANLTDFTAFLIGGVSKFDPQISSFLPEDCVFRIYRDVRFAKDKSPYKNNLGAYINPGGRKSMAPGYYFHLQPAQSFIAGGKHMPDSAELLKIRNAIANGTDEFLKILTDNTYQKLFGEMRGDKLMKAPKGYPADHKAVEYLKLKEFMAFIEFHDDKFL
ncbi:MAG: DUF2461 domain-containing protein, partial [Pyrinomonadaceae bacterium]